MADNEHEYLLGPDCRDGKHDPVCDGIGWDVTADMPCPCRCMCHHPEPESTCATCGHFFTPELEGQTTCSQPCEILKNLDADDSDQIHHIGGF